MKQNQFSRRMMLISTTAVPFLILGTGVSISPAWASSGNLVPRDTYKEILKYRIQTERSTKPIRKIDLILNAFIEDHYDPLKDQIQDIENGTDGKGGFLNTLSFVSRFLPAKYKRVGRAIQIMDFGSEKLNSIRKKEDKIKPAWEASLNKSVDLLYDIVESSQNDNQRTKYINILNEYLSKDVGRVDATTEELLSQFPDFKDHKAVQALVKKDGNTALSKQDVKAILDELRDFGANLKQLNEARIADEERRMSEQEYQAKLLEIDNVTSLGNFAITVLRRDNEDFASQAAIALNAYSQGAKILAAMNKHGDSLSQVAGAANLTMLSLNVVSALGALGQKSADQLVMESLQELKSMIIESTTQILEGIDMLSSQIDQAMVLISAVYDKVQQNANSLQLISEDLETAKQRLIASDEKLSTQIRTLEERNLGRLITRANGEKETVPPRLWAKTSKDFRSQVTELRKYAIEFSRDELSIDNLSRNFDLSEIGNELSKLSPIRNLSFLLETIKVHFSDGSSLVPSLDFDPVTLYESSAALIELIKDWPEYQSDINSDVLDQVVQDIEHLMSISDSLKYVDSGGWTREFYTNMRNKALSLSSAYLRGLEDSVGDQLSERLKLADRVSSKRLDYSELDSFIGRFKFIDFVAQHKLKGTVPVKASFPEGHWKGEYELFIPGAEFDDRLPRDIKAAFCLGLINLKCRFTNDDGHGFRNIQTLAQSPMFENPSREYLLFQSFDLLPRSSGSSGGVTIVIAPTYNSAYYNQTPQEVFTGIISSPSFGIGTAKYDPNTEEISAVRRQSFWNQWRPKLRESLAHLVCVIMRRVCCDASVALRMSSV